MQIFRDQAAAAAARAKDEAEVAAAALEKRRKIKDAEDVSSAVGGKAPFW